MERIDLSHAIEHGLVTYEGLPAPVVCDFLSREASRGRCDNGTYIDSPFHRFADGIDDDTRTGTRPVHTALLGAGIPIVEHLCNLEQLPDTGCMFTAVPAPVRGLGSFPVRAYATLG